MAIKASGIARVRHAETGVVYEIDAEELDWQEEGEDRRGMGPERRYWAEIDHPELGELTWSLFEYPIGVVEMQNFDPGPHEVVEAIKFDLEDEGQDQDDDDDDRVARIDRLVTWFHEHYEDPAERLPYESREGGYQWIWGGPYDAHEELSAEFPDEGEAIIEAAVAEIEADGLFEWAPVSDPSDYDDGRYPEPDPSEEEPALVAQTDEQAEAVDPAISELSAILRDIPSTPGPMFAPDAQNRIELSGWTATEEPDAALVDALRALAEDLAADLDGTNAHQDLLNAVRAYSDAVSAVPTSVAGLYIQGVLLENTVGQVVQDIAQDERPPLPGSVPGRLKSLQDLHGTLIMVSATGQALVEAAVKYRESSDAQAARKVATERLAASIAEDKDLFGPEARALVIRASETMGRPPHPARSNQISFAVVSSTVGAVALYAGDAILKTLIGDGVAASGLGVAALDGVTVLANHALSFLAAHLEPLRTFAAVAGPDLGWLTRLADWMTNRGRQ